ncbi:MAG: hypothetical protein HDR09_10105 [Lachnospiraceae bacterium]|nr:hypothetical protein [Lachnospiraceae bacterium]
MMNLIILQILTSGEFRIGVKEWNYISQFLRLNVPLPKRDPKKDTSVSESDRKLRIDPYEEIILKFMDLFLLKREGEDIILIKKTQIDKFERENLQEVRMDVSIFMQDDVTQRVYQLHNSDSSLDQKQQYRFELERQGFDFGFELVVEQMRIDANHVEQCTLYNLHDIVHLGCRCLHKNPVDAALVLDWLMYISRIIDKMPQITKAENQRRDHHKREYWQEFTETILELYGSETKVVSVLLEIVKKLGCEDILMHSHWLRYVLAHQPNLVSNLEVVFAEIIPAISIEHAYEHVTDSYYLGIDSIQLQDIDSPKTVAALLKFLYMAGRISPSDSILKDIQDKWIYYFRELPEEMPTLLKVYLRMGEFDSVKKFFRNLEDIGTNWISRLLYLDSDTIAEFLTVAQVVRQDWNFSKRIMQCLRKKSTIMDVVSSKPDIIILLLRYGLLSNPVHEDTRLLTVVFLDRYYIMFEYNPEQAVYLLYQIDLKEIDYNNRDKFCAVCIYSMQHFNLVLEASVKTAVHLLTLFEKKDHLIDLNSMHVRKESLMNVRERVSFCVKCCFNKALLTRDRTVVSSLEGLLDSLLPDVIMELKGYFYNKFPFLQAYSWKLAKKVKAMYGMD